MTDDQCRYLRVLDTPTMALWLPIHRLPALSRRSFTALSAADIKYVSDLVQKTDQELLKISRFGRKGLLEVKHLLSGLRLTVGMALDDPPSRADLDEHERKNPN